MKLFNKTTFITVGLATGLVAASVTLLSFYTKVDINHLNYSLNESTLVLDKSGVLLDEIHGEEHRKVTTLDN
ncbi:hypothetical protein, partial [Streptococcus pneumoniae]|uniref:hypothetical protein n=1 Tax=Streptococcus pneumoniae TaxID=1313 RepID=UPI001E52E561